MVGKWGGRQMLSLGRGCYSDSTIAHEFIHAIGFWHEQSRPDRDEYVRINFENIIRSRHRVFDKQRTSLTFGLPYDGLSVMHYEHWGFANPGKSAISSKVSIRFF